MAVLLVSFERARRPSAGASRPAEAGAQPQVRLRFERSGKTFTFARATFLVVPGGGEQWARDITKRDPGRDQRWVVLAVVAHNLGRGRFNPARLSYRLRGRRGGLFFPDRRGAVGPPELPREGTLSRGHSAEVRLGFRLPRRQRQLLLVFEPREDAALQVRVRLRGV